MAEIGAPEGVLTDALREALACALGPIGSAAVALEGGITNRNFRLSLGGEDYVVRLCGKDTAVLGIDRRAEVEATRAAHALGLAPDVALYLPEHECVVTRFVEARPATAEQLRQGPVLSRVAGALRAFHSTAQLPTSFDAFRVGEVYCAQTLARGGTVPAAFADAKALAGRIETALVHPEHDPVPCHNDLLTGNFLVRADGQLTIVDWEYAGMGDPYFDLGNLSVNTGFDEDDDRRLLEAYWGEPASERRLAALRLMRIMSDYREAAWGVIQSVLSELDFDYEAYADKHLGRLLDAAADPRLERWLDAASS